MEIKAGWDPDKSPNLISVNYLKDWNKLDPSYPSVVTQGKDTGGSFYMINASPSIAVKLFNGSISISLTLDDIFQNKIKYQPGKQYRFKIRARYPSGKRCHCFRVVYTDGVNANMCDPGGDIGENIFEMEYITSKGKDISKIVGYMLASTAGNTNIYEIGLYEI